MQVFSERIYSNWPEKHAKLPLYLIDPHFPKNSLIFIESPSLEHKKLHSLPSRESKIQGFPQDGLGQ